MELTASSSHALYSVISVSTNTLKLFNCKKYRGCGCSNDSTAAEGVSQRDWERSLEIQI